MKAGLTEKFYKAYDPSRLLTEWRAAEAGQRPLNGAGRHFQSFHIKSPIKGLDLALNIARETFLNDRSDLIRNWQQACEKLQAFSRNEALLPPFEILSREGDGLAVVMPFCEEAVAAAELRHEPLKGYLDQLSAALGGAGLALDDYWQLRRCQGHPFVIDFSELRMQAEGAGPRLRR